MTRRAIAPQWVLVAALAAALMGCGDAAPTAAPPITGKVKEWKDMTKEEKIELLKKQPMPESARQAEIAKVNAGQS